MKRQAWFIQQGLEADATNHLEEIASLMDYPQAGEPQPTTSLALRATAIQVSRVRNGSKPEVGPPERHVRSTHNSRHRRRSSGLLRIADLDRGCDNHRMTDLNASERRARSIVERNGGVVRRRDDHLMCIEIAADAVWKLCVLPLTFLGTREDRLLYNIDLSAMRLPVFGA